MALAFGTAAAVVLVSLGVFLHGRLGTELDRSLHDGLRQRAGDLARQLADDRRLDLSQNPLIEPGDDVVQVLRADGSVQAATPGFDSTPVLRPPEVRGARGGVVTVERRDLLRGDGPFTIVAVGTAGRLVAVGSALEGRDEALANLDRLLVFGVPVAILLASLSGFLVAGRGLRPIEVMRRRADAIGTGDLAQRLPEPAAQDELRRLADTLNGMLGRLEAGFERERTFVADASHELRTPLARLKAELQLAARPGRDREALAHAVRSSEAEVDHLIRLTNDLLSLVRADGLPVRRRPASLREVVDAAVRRAGASPVKVVGPVDVTVDVDTDRIEQAIGNLLENGRRHGRGQIVVTVSVTDDDLVVRVTDEGPGIPASLRPTAFERFTRADPSRADGGAGIGLAIVAAVAAAHGGGASVGDDGWVQLRIPRAVGAYAAGKVTVT